MCSEQLFCSCPPFLRHPGTQQQLHFTKHNYDDQYAILGKAKVGGAGRVGAGEHCSLVCRSCTAAWGPATPSCSGTRTGRCSPGPGRRAGPGAPSSTGATQPLVTLRHVRCCSNNQSLILLEVGAEDAGRFRCEAVSAAGRRLGHTTRLRTFPPPVFAHPPIWNTQPEDVRVGLYVVVYSEVETNLHEV